ncbi:helix-turn-helix domain-containing protein [Streptomyces sp. NPDC088847]|uniref:helix-turn-helix domain-containing protein n=1 Tax=Streptomyces sp. NPDC088847 TaxID=3365909 RepID=UPI0037F5698E
MTDDHSPSPVLQQGLETLQDLLGPEWEVSVEPEPLPGPDMGWDAVLRVLARHDSRFTDLLVDVREHLTPKEVAGYLNSTAGLVRRISPNSQLVVFAPWISAKTQEELRQREIGYLDLTGNISLRVSRPAIVIHTEGDVRAPAAARSTSTKPLLTGPRAGRLVRLLADVHPPYRATELAKHAGLSLPYVSRLLDALEDQLLIGRNKKLVTSVDWQNLLRNRASHLDLMRQTTPQGMLAPNGVQAVLDRLVEHDGIIAGAKVLVTGSYAARPVAPVAVGGQLMLYVMPHSEHVRAVSKALKLIPVPEAADVQLLQAPDLSIFQRPRRYDRYRQVGLSQLVLDCLSGPGRMPAEGETVLEHMAVDEHLWRVPDLSHLPEVNLQTDQSELF